MLYDNWTQVESFWNAISSCLPWARTPYVLSWLRAFSVCSVMFLEMISYKLQWKLTDWWIRTWKPCVIPETVFLFKWQIFTDYCSLIIVHWASELSSMWNCCHWLGICKVALHPIFCHTNYSASCLCLNCRGDSFVHWLCVWSCKVVICTPVVLQIDHRWLQIG